MIDALISNTMIMSIINHPDFFLYLGIPITSAIVGWGTNVIAIEMMFLPIEFFGIPPYLGWQGVIPRKAFKMANITIDTMIPKLITVEELFSRIDPSRVALEIGPFLDGAVERITEEVMESTAPTIWESLPQRIKDEVMGRIKRDLPAVITVVMEETKNNITDIFEIRSMIMGVLMKNKTLINTIFRTCGVEEFKLIRKSGIYFGLLFGLIQMIIWVYYKPWWLLPVAGAFVGYATNWLALKMIFFPIEPIHIGHYKWQGLFLKRQHEVSDEYAKMVSKDVLNSENILNAIISGPGADKVQKIIHKHVKRSIDQATGFAKPVIQIVIGTNDYIKMKNSVCESVMDELPEQVQHMEEYSHQVMDIENVLSSKMKGLPTREFERVLHPAFEEDEWILIMVGAVLGMCVGFFQLFYIFEGSIG
ncbi:DUF445 domain-containing protein [Deltaproteobacteria bacterium TL4]